MVSRISQRSTLKATNCFYQTIMSKFDYDVAVAWRVYPKVSTASNAPRIFPDDKSKLCELCLTSFKESIGGLRVKLWEVLNSCPPEYDAIFKRVWGSENLVIVHYPGVAPSVTLNEAARILMNQTDAEIIYSACDDYFFLPGQFHEVVDFIKKNPDADFVTVYDHPDLYTTDLHNLPCETRAFGGKNWISCTSTTDTFITTRKTLTGLQEFLTRLRLAFPNTHSPDLGTWMALTKKRVFNPFKFVYWALTHPYWAASIFYAWVYGWRQILFGRRYKLWVPRPSIATHMVANLEAPNIDWQKEFQRYAPAISSKSGVVGS